MKIQVTFFKDTGKYYSGGEVEIDDSVYLHSNNFKQEIVNNQKIMLDGWQGYYSVSTGETMQNRLDPNYTRFYTRLFQPYEFKDIKKSNFNKSGIPKQLKETKNLFQKFGYAYESDCEFYLVSEHNTHANKIGLKVGVVNHNCHIESSEFIVLMFLNEAGKQSFDDFGEIWIKKL